MANPRDDYALLQALGDYLSEERHQTLQRLQQDFNTVNEVNSALWNTINSLDSQLDRVREEKMDVEFECEQASESLRLANDYIEDLLRELESSRATIRQLQEEKAIAERRAEMFSQLWMHHSGA